MLGFDALISCLRRLSLCSVSFPPSLCLSFLCVSILRSPRLSSPGFLWFSAMMRQAPTARKVLLLALVLLLGCQGDGGSRLLGWGWGLIDFICLPGWGRKMGVKVGGGRGVCHTMPHTLSICSLSCLHLALSLCSGPCTQWPYRLGVEAASAAKQLWESFL